ncbi:MAG TPA: winged helix-turn-helix domain-containing protein [Solirubrobacteraceae bacterium]|nr:winged helix-turn-helix domain-containing protein [Solirubrobacteraceae bacterium]
MEIADIDVQAAIGAPMLDEIRRTAERRLREIEPLIEEAERLREVLAVIERRSIGGSSERARALRTRGEQAHSAVSPRAAKGANKRLILELVGERPGITPAEIARTTGLKRTVVASTVSRLKRYGELRDYEQGGVCLPGLATVGAAVGSTSRRRPSTAPATAKRSRRLAPAA